MGKSGPDAGALTRVGGNLALDFANTVSGRGTLHERDHLRSPAHVRDWGLSVGIVDGAQKLPPTGDEETAEAWLAQALALRAVVQRIGGDLARKREPDAQDLRRLQDRVAGDLQYGHLARRGGRFEPNFSAAPFPHDVLGTVAWSALDLLRAGVEERIKLCPAEDCGWLFLDGSKNNSRIWCDMAVCGNRMKARRHRSRGDT